MKKTVTEWLGEVKLYEKKIDKIEKKSYNITITLIN